MNITLVNEKEKTEAFYIRLKEKLAESTVWPSKYLYKFIIPSNLKKKEAIAAIFNHTGAVIDTKKSSNGKYTSLSIMVHLNTPDEVIAYYKKVHTIEGVIAL